MKPPADHKGRTATARPAVPAVLALLLLAAALPSSGMTIHLKLSGSYGFPAFDDANLALKGWAESWRREAATTPTWSFTGGKDGRLRGAPGIEGEVLLGLTPRWSIGVGSGYALSEVSEGATTLDIVRSSIPYVYARPTRMAATPLFVSSYYSLPIGSRLGLYVGAGAGLVRMRYSATDAVKRAASSGFSYSNEQSASGRGNLVQGVAGFTYARDGNLGLDALTNGPGTLYAYEEYQPDLDFWQAKMDVLEGPPAGETFRSVRKAVADASGLVLKAGFLIKF
jgi:opacity protein-like surface antigen